MTLDAFDDARRRAARAANEALFVRRGTETDALRGSDRVRVAARLFRAHASAENRAGAHRDMSPADLAAWTRAAEACERESPGTGQFWRAVRECLAETQRSVASGEEEPETETTTSETGDSRHLRALEASWELLFVAARVWRSVELDGGGRVAETDPSAGRVSRSHCRYRRITSSPASPGIWMSTSATIA